MRFLIDAQLSPLLVDWFQAKGHDADHVAVALSPSAPDIEIVRLAEQSGAIIVSKDADFVSLLEERPSAPLLLRVCLGNAVNRVLIARLEADWPRIEAELNVKKPVVEIG